MIWCHFRERRPGTALWCGWTWHYGGHFSGFWGYSGVPLGATSLFQDLDTSLWMLDSSVDLALWSWIMSQDTLHVSTKALSSVCWIKLFLHGSRQLSWCPGTVLNKWPSTTPRDQQGLWEPLSFYVSWQNAFSRHFWILNGRTIAHD